MYIAPWVYVFVGKPCSTAIISWLTMVGTDLEVQGGLPSMESSNQIVTTAQPYSNVGTTCFGYQDIVLPIPHLSEASEQQVNRN